MQETSSWLRESRQLAQSCTVSDWPTTRTMYTTRTHSLNRSPGSYRQRKMEMAHHWQTVGVAVNKKRTTDVRVAHVALVKIKM